MKESQKINRLKRMRKEMHNAEIFFVGQEVTDSSLFEYLKQLGTAISTLAYIQLADLEKPKIIDLPQRKLKQ